MVKYKNEPALKWTRPISPSRHQLCCTQGSGLGETGAPQQVLVKANSALRSVTHTVEGDTLT